MQAYNLEMLPKPAERGASDNHGWCFGLPPGISSAQWPLDPNNGYPLMHGFTVLLPEEYRVHGEEIVALSFFACAPDHNDGSPETTKPIAALFEAPGSTAPSDPSLLPFWQSVRSAHPRLSRMEDILGCAYALILLTQVEFDGPLCLPPRLSGNALLDQTAPPAWLAMGAARSYWKSNFSGMSKLPVEDTFMFKLLGQLPEEDVSFHRALSWSARREDPNAGVAARAPEYQEHFYWEEDKVGRESYREHAWGADHQPNHIGGTMRPVQSPPEIGPFYIGFEEYFGGYNFGGDGNAQLDFGDMKFDWACG